MDAIPAPHSYVWSAPADPHCGRQGFLFERAGACAARLTTLCKRIATRGILPEDDLYLVAASVKNRLLQESDHVPQKSHRRYGKRGRKEEEGERRKRESLSVSFVWYPFGYPTSIHARFSQHNSISHCTSICQIDSLSVHWSLSPCRSQTGPDQPVFDQLPSFSWILQFMRRANLLTTGRPKPTQKVSWLSAAATPSEQRMCAPVRVTCPKSRAVSFLSASEG